MPGPNQPLVYVSYAWRSRSPDGQAAALSPSDDRESIVDQLCQVLDQEDQIVVGRDKKLVKTGDSIEDFAGEIATSGLIIAVISSKSLRSEWCMKDELLQAFRVRNYRQKQFGLDVLPLILDDAEADFQDDTSLLDLWSERVDRKRKKLERVDPQRKFSRESWQDVDEMEELLGRLPDLLRVFKIRSMPRGVEAIQEEGFHEIRQLVLKRLQEKSNTAFESNMAAIQTQDGLSVHKEEVSYETVALVIGPTDGHGREGEKPSHEWKAFIKKAGEHDFELIPNGQILGAHPSYSRDSLEQLLQCVTRWIGKHLEDEPLLEIYAPAQLLDEHWGSMRVHVDPTDGDEDLMPLHSYMPYLLRSSDRLLNSDWKVRRTSLKRMHNKLVTGDGVWLAPDLLGKKQIVGTLDGKHSARAGGVITAIRCLHSAAISERQSWLRLIVKSMAPLVIWPARPRHGFLDQELVDDEVQDLLHELPLILDDRPHCPDLPHLARTRLEKARDDNEWPFSKIDLGLSILVDHPDHCPDPQLLQSLFPPRQDPNSASESSSPSAQIYIST